MTAPDQHPPRLNPQKLFEVFARQLNLSEEFLQILDEEKTALAAMDMQTLIKLAKKKENQLARIQLQEGSLREEAARLLPDLAGQGIRLTDITPLVSAEEARRLTGCRERLLVLREEILARNLFNQRFADDTRQYLDDAIRLITSAVAERPMYSPPRGQRKPYNTSQPSLLSREV